MRGDLLALIDHLATGLEESFRAHQCRARTSGAAARLELDTGRLAAIRAQARNETPEVIALFFPDQG